MSANTKTLIYFFSGVALLAGVVALGFFSTNQHLITLVGLMVLAAGVLIGVGLFMPWSRWWSRMGWFERSALILLIFVYPCLVAAGRMMLVALAG